MTPQDKGREWEEIWAKKVQGETTPGSGNQPHNKLDVRTKRIIWSNKWTGGTSITLYKSTLDEARDSSDSPGGYFDKIPGIALRIEGGEDYVILRADDFLDLMTGEPLIKADKAAVRRASAKIPELLKE